MKIAFLDFISWDYIVEDVYHQPMGGSQSANCYLTEALAKLGHEIFLINHTSRSVVSRGVTCLNLLTLLPDKLRSLDLDVCVVLQRPGLGKKLRSFLSKKTLLVFLAQNAHVEAVMAELKDPVEQDAYDAFAMVSSWQGEQCIQHFGIDRTRVCVLNNAVSPAFQNLFTDREDLLRQKFSPPILAYTSTPYRGLEVLVDVFPQIRSIVPDVRLKVFSSMKVYQYSSSNDEDKFGKLYEKCQNSEGIEYVGSIPQPQLAKQLREVSILAYPNIYPEMSSVAVMEGMASGCQIVSTELAGLPETTAGFARLIPLSANRDEYKQEFVTQIIESLQAYARNDRTELANRLFNQVNYVNRYYVWEFRAKQWIEWLEELIQKKHIELRYQTDLPIAYWTPEDLHYQRDRYEYIIEFCDRAIRADPSIKRNYWYLGMALLMQNKEEEAQMVWLSALENLDSVENSIQELINILENEADRQEKNGNLSETWLLRQYIYENASEDIDNLLRILCLATSCQNSDWFDLDRVRQLCELLEATPPIASDPNLMLFAISRLAESDQRSPLFQIVMQPNFIDALLKYYQNLKIFACEYRLRPNPHVMAQQYRYLASIHENTSVGRIYLNMANAIDYP